MPVGTAPGEILPGAAYRVDELCARLGIGRRKFGDLVRQGLKPRYIGRKPMILADDVLAMLREAPTTNPTLHLRE